MEEDKNKDICGASNEDIWKQKYRHGPMDYAKKLKLGFRLDDLDLTREKNQTFQSSAGGARAYHDVPVWPTTR